MLSYLYKEGDSINDVCEETGYGRRVIERILRENYKIRTSYEQKSFKVECKHKGEETKKKILSTYENGLTPDEVAKETGLSRSYVRYIIGISGRTRKGRKTEKVKELYSKGITKVSEISKEVGCSEVLVRNVLKEEGIDCVELHRRDDIDEKELYEKYKNGASLKQLQEHYHASWGAIRSRIDKMKSKECTDEKKERVKKKITINVGDLLEREISRDEYKRIQIVSLNNNMIVTKDKIGLTETFTLFDVMQEFKKGHMRKVC